MRVALSLSLLFLAVSSCFSSGSETDRFEEKKRAIKETQPPQAHSLAEQKTSSSLIRFIIIIIVFIIIILIILSPKSTTVWIKYLLFLLTDCIFWLFRKPLQKKKTRSTRVRVSHNTRAHSRASAPTPSKLPFTRIIVLLNKRKTWARVLFARARVYI